MLTLALINDCKELVKEITLSLRGEANRAFASETAAVSGNAVGCLTEAYDCDDTQSRARLMLSAHRSLKRLCVLIEAGIDTGIIPEKCGNRWLQRGENICSRLEKGISDEKRRAGMIIDRLAPSEVLFDTARLCVRTVCESDLHSIVELCDDPQYVKRGVECPSNRDEARTLIRQYLSDGEVFIAKRKNQNELVAVIVLRSNGDSSKRKRMNIIVAKAYRGRGYSIEALEGVVKYMFDNTDVDILSVYIPHSMKYLEAVAERYGFRKEGIARNFSYDCEDMTVMSVTRR